MAQGDVQCVITKVHSNVVNALAMPGFWLPTFANNLANAQEHSTGDAWQLAHTPETRVMGHGCQQSKGFQKAYKSKRHCAGLGFTMSVAAEPAQY